MKQMSQTETGSDELNSKDLHIAVREHLHHVLLFVALRAADDYLMLGVHVLLHSP